MKNNADVFLMSGWTVEKRGGNVSMFNICNEQFGYGLVISAAANLAEAILAAIDEQAEPEDEPERPAVIVIYQQSPAAYARDCNAAYDAGYRFVSAAFPYAVMQLTLDAQKKDRKAKQQSKAGEGRTLTGGMTL